MYTRTLPSTNFNSSYQGQIKKQLFSFNPSGVRDRLPTDSDIFLSMNRESAIVSANRLANMVSYPLFLYDIGGRLVISMSKPKGIEFIKLTSSN